MVCMLFDVQTNFVYETYIQKRQCVAAIYVYQAILGPKIASTMGKIIRMTSNILKKRNVYSNILQTDYFASNAVIKPQQSINQSIRIDRSMHIEEALMEKGKEKKYSWIIYNTILLIQEMTAIRGWFHSTYYAMFILHNVL